MKAKNRNPFTEQCKNRSLSDKAYDLLGELLLEQETNQMLDELNGDKANGTSAEMDAFFAAHDNLQVFSKAAFEGTSYKNIAQGLPACCDRYRLHIHCGQHRFGYQQNRPGLCNETDCNHVGRVYFVETGRG